MKYFLLTLLGLIFSNTHANIVKFHKETMKPYNAIMYVEDVLNQTFLFNPVTLPLIENFDETSHAFTLINGSQTNQWVVGSSTFASGTHSLYISNNGSANMYSPTSQSVVQAYTQVSIPANAVDMALSFDFKCHGESTHDYMRVWLVPDTFTPTAGTQITAANSGGVLLSVGPHVNNTLGNLNGTANGVGTSFQTQFQNLNFIFPAGNFVGQNAKLVFEWRNDPSLANNPPAAVDNVHFTVLSCPQPIDLELNQVTTTTAEVAWTATGTETQWEVIILDAFASSPLPTDTGVIVNTPNHTFENLNESTEYQVYVRAVCSETDKSFWSGPLAFYTTQTPASIPYTENFDGENPVITFINGTQTNKWMLGNATFQSPNHAVYISNNNNANAYSNSTTHSFFYRDLAVPANVVDLSVQFHWKGVGNSSDYMKVWLAPTSYNPTPGVGIVEGNGVSLVGTNFYGQNEWTIAVNAVNAQAFAGSTARLIFEFVCNASTLNQPPPAVDNILVEPITCPQPVDLNVTKNNQGQMVISWTPTGNETQWELVIQGQNEGYPDGTETTIVVNNTPNYAFNATQGLMYEVYVRAYCSETEQSLWTGPESFSDFNPPACADLDIAPLDLNINDNGEYIICDGEEVTIPLNATFDAESFKSTTSYSVEQIDYAPPFPFIGGIEMNISTDDLWSPKFDLPFNFCFFGEEYNSVKIGSNGIIGFSVPDNDTSCPWAFTDPIPSTNFATEVRNAIYGVYQDINPATNNLPLTENKSINYQVLGTYPCRALVVNFNDILQFSCGATSGVQTSQVVIYEITNIIEVYVKRRVPCNSWQNGAGLIGIQNEEGTLAYTPPGRNTGNWSAENEAWRFTPNGETTVDFAWYANGEIIGTDQEMDYTINETTHFEAVISYPGCGGEDLELRKPFTVRLSEQIILPNRIDPVVVCQYEGVDPKVDLTALIGDIMQNIEEPEAFSVDFYLTEEDADADTNKIIAPESYTPQSFPQTIHVRVTSIETACYELTSFRIIKGQEPNMPLPEDVVICTSYELPNLPDELFSYHEIVSKDLVTGFPIETITDARGGTILPIGDYDITIRMESVDGCEKYIEYNVSVIACDLPKGISPNGDGINDALELTGYRPLMLRIYNRHGKEVYSHGPGYTNQWVGQDNNGNALPDGTYFIDLVTPFERFTQWIQINR